jgi:hypothetical protein
MENEKKKEKEEKWRKTYVIVCKDVLNSTWELTVSSLCSGSNV